MSDMLYASPSRRIHVEFSLSWRRYISYGNLRHLAGEGVEDTPCWSWGQSID